MNQNVDINILYKKLTNIEEHMMAIEHILLPEMKVNKLLAKRLEKARKEMRKGEYLGLSELK
jgi:transcriptional regulator of aromatic amino acid metabolism